MLASTPSALTWPRSGFWVQPKFDGLRCLIDPVNGPITRSGAPLPCPSVRAALSDPRLAGLDGELTAVGGLEAAQSAFMGQGAPPQGWRFTAFDDLKSYSRPFEARLRSLRAQEAGLPTFALVSPARFAASAGDAAEAFAAVVADHRAQDASRALDGMILRSPDHPYREGSTTAHRAECVKMKPMSESEAPILDVAARHDDRRAIGSVLVAMPRGGAWVPAGLRRPDARRLWEERYDLEGQRAVIRRWGATARGSPRHAIAVAIRRDLPK